MPDGAIYWNAFYPGSIAVLPNSAFQVACNDRAVLLHIVRHINPIVITDFANDFAEHNIDGRKHIALTRSIDVAPKNAISAEFKTGNTQRSQWFICTRDHDYCLYRRQSFTELTVGCEFDGLDGWRDTSMAIFFQALERFVEVYRAASRDVSIARPGSIARNYPILRQGVTSYSDAQRGLPAYERLTEALPSHFAPVLFSFREYAIDAPADLPDRQQLTEEVGHHLAAGTAISRSQNALLDCFEMIVATKRFRYGLMEAFSIIELEGFDLLSDLRERDAALDARAITKERRSPLTSKDLVHSFLPRLLDQELRRWPGLIAELDQTRKLRHRVIHERYEANHADVELALNTAQRLLFAIEARRQRSPLGSA